MTRTEIAALGLLAIVACSEGGISATPPKPPATSSILRVAVPMSRPAFKGVELYSWRGEDGQWRYSLFLGTNRGKPLSLITAPENTVVGEAALERNLGLLAGGESVFWLTHPTDSTDESGQLAYPPSAIVSRIDRFCETAGITLERM